MPLLPAYPPIHPGDERGNGELQSQLVYVYSAGLNDGQYHVSDREKEDCLANKIINSITNKNNYIITTKLIAKVLSGQTEGLTRGQSACWRRWWSCLSCGWSPLRHSQGDDLVVGWICQSGVHKKSV